MYWPQQRKKEKWICPKRLLKYQLNLNGPSWYCHLTHNKKENQNQNTKIWAFLLVQNKLQMENWSIGLCFSMHCHSSFLKCWTDWFQVKNSLLDCLTLLFFLYRRDQNYPNRFVRIIMLVHIGSTVDLHRLCKTDCFTMVFP